MVTLFGSQPKKQVGSNPIARFGKHFEQQSRTARAEEEAREGHVPSMVETEAVP
jgi:hypothetical protein